MILFVNVLIYQVCNTGLLGGIKLAAFLLDDAVLILTFASGGILDVVSPQCWLPALHRYGAMGSSVKLAVLI